MFNGKKLQLLDARKHPARTFSQVQGRASARSRRSATQSLFVTAQGGQIEVFKLRYEDGKKLQAPQFCAERPVWPAGSVLGA